MPFETAFAAANAAAIAGWAALLAAPFLPRAADAIAGAAIPQLLSIAYAGLILAFWSRADGGFDSLAAVMQLFDTAPIALAGWIHGHRASPAPGCRCSAHRWSGPCRG